MKNLIKELNPSEWELINLIRTKYKFGEITIITRDGLPERIMKTISYESVKFTSKEK